MKVSSFLFIQNYSNKEEWEKTQCRPKRLTFFLFKKVVDDDDYFSFWRPPIVFKITCAVCSHYNRWWWWQNVNSHAMIFMQINIRIFFCLLLLLFHYDSLFACMCVCVCERICLDEWIDKCQNYLSAWIYMDTVNYRLVKIEWIYLYHHL